MASDRLKGKMDAFGFHAQQMQMPKGAIDQEAEESEAPVTVVLHVTPRWSESEGLEVVSRVGNVVVGSCDVGLCDSLAQEPDVLGIEVDRGKGRIG